MRKPGFNNILSWLIGYFVIAIVLCPVLLLLDHPIKYVLYIFGLSLTGLLFLICAFRYDYKFKLAIPHPVKIIDFFLIVCSITLLVSNMFANPIMNMFANPIVNISFILAVIVSFFLPGWALLRLLGIDCRRASNVVFLVLPFSLSIGLTSLIFTFALPFTAGGATLLSAIYVIVSLLPLLKDYLHRSYGKLQAYASNRVSKHNLFDVLLLAWVSLFFLFIILNIYPQMAYVPGLDIVRHFSSSKGLILAPDIYVGEYPWFHFTWTSVYELSAPPMWLFQSGIACLSLMLIFSFYIMAKAYLSDVDRRAHLLATVFFSVFSGFGWLYFMQEKLNIPDPAKHFDILRMSNNVSYWDIGYGQGPWLWFWFRPLTLGFTIFFVLLYLMRREDLTKRNYITVSSLLILTLSLVHFSELFIFVVLLFILALLCPTTKLRLRETAISTLIGLTASALLTTAYQNLFGFASWKFSYEYLFILAVLAGSAYILIRYPKRPRIAFKGNLTIVASISLFVYSALLFYWFSNADSFSVSYVRKILAVPWELYPVLLGIVGLFAILGIILIAKNYRSHPIVIFAVLFVLAIVFGRAITYLNAGFMDTGYWERRIIPFVYASASLLAPLIVLKLKRLRGFNKMLTVAFISFLVLGGVTSTFLTAEYWVLNVPRGDLTYEEVKLLSYLNDADPYSTLLTVTGRSLRVAEYASLGWIINYYRFPLWQARSPELPLNILSSLNSPAIIFLHERDLKGTATTYRNGYIASHLLNVVPAIYEGSEGEILQVPRLAPPSSSSDMVLVLPEDGDNFFYAYDILSLGGYNYTTALLSDVNTLRKAKIVVAPSEEIATELMRYKDEYNLQYEILIVFNLDGYGRLTDVYTIPYNSPLVVVEDNASTEWIASGMLSGEIGVPKLTDNPDIKISGNNSLAINVGAGEYAYWQISRLFEEPVNLAEFEFITFYWYGRGDGGWYVLQFTSEPGYFWYRFQDSWKGWRQVILPMWVPDGCGQEFGVTFDKATREGASWAKIGRIDVRLEATNPNQGGEFYIDRFAFDSMLQSSSIIGVSNAREIQFPTDLNLIPLQSNYEVTAYYDGGTPFILHTTRDGYEMFYLNVNPIIQRLALADDDARHIYLSLGELLELVDAKLPAYEFMGRGKLSPVTGGVSAFKKATFTGYLTLKSSSAVISVDAPSIGVNIDGEDLTLNGISQIIPLDIDEATLEADRAIIDGGSGFYTQVLLNQSSIHFTGQPVILSVFFNNGSATTINGKEIQINLAKSNISLRQPTVTSIGNILFESFYGFGELAKSIRVLGQGLQIEGIVTFKIEYGDVFTVTHGFSFSGELIRSEPLYPYDELGSLYNLFTPSYLPLLLLIALIFTIVYFIIPRKNRSVLNRLGIRV